MGNCNLVSNKKGLLCPLDVMFFARHFSPPHSFQQALVNPAEALSQTSIEQWYRSLGHTLALECTGKTTGDVTTWMLAENSPRQGVPFHKHVHEDESFYVIEGQFEMNIGEVTVSGGHEPSRSVHAVSRIGGQM